jgi:Winged helix-turn-helix DNA-binding
MPSTTAVLDEARALIKRRLDEVDGECRRLERALAELGGKAKNRGPGRPRGSRIAKPGSTRRRRRRVGRGDQALRAIAKDPGITASDIAKKLKVKPNYLYRVLGDLEKEKRVKKDGRKYFPVG